MSTEVQEKLEALDLTGALYTSELTGSDETGDGTESKPFKTAAHVFKIKNYFYFFLNTFLKYIKALRHSGDVEHFSKILVDAKDQTKVDILNLIIKEIFKI